MQLPRDWCLYWLALAAVDAVDGPLVKQVAHHVLCSGLIDDTLIDLDGGDLSGEERVATCIAWLQSHIEVTLDRRSLALIAGSRWARKGLAKGRRRSEIAFSMPALVGDPWDEGSNELKGLRMTGEEAYDYEIGYYPGWLASRKETAIAKRCVAEVNEKIDMLAHWYSGLSEQEEALVVWAGERYGTSSFRRPADYWFEPSNPPKAVRKLLVDSRRD